MSESNGPLVEILSVLKAMNFVFTENPLQAVVPRTLGMTQLWDIHMALSLFSQCGVLSPKSGISGDFLILHVVNCRS